MLVKLWRCRIISFLFVGFKTIILCSIVGRLMFYSLYDSRNIWFLLKYGSWNTNHESLNQTLVRFFKKVIFVFNHRIMSNSYKLKCHELLFEDCIVATPNLLILFFVCVLGGSVFHGRWQETILSSQFLFRRCGM